MARLRVLSGRDVCRILQAHGFSEARRKGSHVAMQKRGAGSTVTVIVPDHRELRIGTLQSIIRQSGLPRALFESLGPTSVREPQPKYRVLKGQLRRLIAEGLASGAPMLADSGYWRRKRKKLGAPARRKHAV